jgi:hypothetical protein
MQRQVADGPLPMTDEQKDAHASNPRINLEEAFIYIDGKRHNVRDLLKLIADKLS